MWKRIKQVIKNNPRLRKSAQWLLGRTPAIEYIPKEIISGSGNKIVRDETAALFNCTIEILGDNNEILISPFCRLNNVKFYIRGSNNKIELGRGVHFNHGGSIWIEDYQCEAVIGASSTFENVHIAVTEPNSKINIGKDCMFAYDIDVRTGDSHSMIDSTTNERLNYAQDVCIGNHVWVAAHVSILKGVEIKDNCIISTRAVVTKSFEEENLLIGGIPARKIKENVNWKRERIYK